MVEMDEKRIKYFTKSTLKWDLDKEKKTSEIDKSIWGGGKRKKKRKRYIPLYFIVCSFHIEEKLRKSFTQLIWKKIPGEFKKSKINMNSGKITEDLKSMQKGKAISNIFANKIESAQLLFKKNIFEIVQSLDLGT